MTRHPLTLSAVGTGIGVLLWMLRALLVSDQSNAQDSGVLPSPPAPVAVVAGLPVEAGDVSAAADNAPNVPVATVVNAAADAGSVRHGGPEIAGHWEHKDAIQRTIIVAADGTAVMQVKLDVLSAFRYGSEMTLNLKWTLEEQEGQWRLTHTIVDGHPEKSVKLLTSDWGTERIYRVLDIETDSMLLETVDGKVKERWVRTSEPSTDAASTQPAPAAAEQ